MISLVYLTSPELTVQLTDHFVSDSELHFVDLFVGQISVHVAVVDPEALALSSRLRVGEVVDALNCFRQVSSLIPHELHEVVLVEVGRNPKSNVFVAGGEFTVRLEFCYFSLRELVQKSGVLAPKHPDVTHLEKLHCPPFKAKAKSPADLLIDISVCVFHHSV